MRQIRKYLFIILLILVLLTWASILVASAGTVWSG